MVPPVVDPDMSDMKKGNDSVSFRFDHKKVSIHFNKVPLHNTLTDSDVHTLIFMIFLTTKKVSIYFH